VDGNLTSMVQSFGAGAHGDNRLAGLLTLLCTCVAQHTPHFGGLVRCLLCPILSTCPYCA
jgi:hypothetical protein